MDPDPDGSALSLGQLETDLGGKKLPIKIVKKVRNSMLDVLFRGL